MPSTALSVRTADYAEHASLLEQLDSAVATGRETQRQRILDQITDLFAAGARGYSSDQIAVFDDVLRELATDIEVSARIRLANRLARIGHAPPALVRSLAFDDEIEVAGPILVHSEQLTDADLVENAATKSQKHLFAIAQRLQLSESVTDVLIERGDRRVVNKVARNKGARFSLAGYGKLTNRARFDRRLSLALVRRGDVPRQYFLKLLEAASATVRSKLENDNPAAAAAIRDTIDDVATALQQESREASDEYAAAMLDAKRRENVSCPITEGNILATAHVQDFERTVVALAKVGRFPVDLVERALLDKGEDMVLILAKAAGCSWTTAKELVRMFVAERNLRPADLAGLLARYKKLTEETARNVIDSYGERVRKRSEKIANLEDRDAIGDVA